MSVPLIDLQLFESSPGEVAQQMHNACRDVGFFYIKSPLLKASHIDDAFEAVHALFDMPLECKEDVAAHKSPLFRGYQGTSSDASKVDRLIPSGSNRIPNLIIFCLPMVP